MKAYIRFLLLLLIIAIISCEKKALEFSCDPEINKFVIDNKKSFASISLDELNSYDISLQRAIFNSWDYSKKHEIWLEKFYTLIQNSVLNDIETSHLNDLINHISEDFFMQKNHLYPTSDHSYFAEEWILFSKEKLGWTEKYIAFVVYRLYTRAEQLDEELSAISDLKEIITSGTETPDCSCNTSFDYCSSSSCNSGNCNTVGGCGWLWSMVCNGTCY